MEKLYLQAIIKKEGGDYNKILEVVSYRFVEGVINHIPKWSLLTAGLGRTITNRRIWRHGLTAIPRPLSTHKKLFTFGMMSIM